MNNIINVFGQEHQCEVCGNQDTPLMRSGKYYCWRHDPISREEFDKIWGITPEMKRPKTRSHTNRKI